MYANILLSTDGSDVARKGVEHGIGLAKALNAKVTVITVRNRSRSGVRSVKTAQFCSRVELCTALLHQRRTF